MSSAGEPRPFRDRADAGRRLVDLLGPRAADDLLVLGIPRGGVPVAAAVAEAYDAPLDLILVRKLGVPGHPEFAMGAIGEGGVLVRSDDVIADVGVSDEDFETVRRREQIELDRRVDTYRGTRPPPVLEGRTVVVVDDGIATGSTARAALDVARAQGAASLVLAVPVAPAGAEELFATVADEVVVVETPRPMRSVGGWYDDFSATDDAEVVRLLAR